MVVIYYHISQCWKRGQNVQTTTKTTATGPRTGSRFNRNSTAKNQDQTPASTGSTVVPVLINNAKKTDNRILKVYPVIVITVARK